MLYNCYSCSPTWGWRNAAPIRTGLRVLTQPTGEQITLDEAKLHLRLDSYGSPPTHPDDSLITMLIVAAREWAENDTGRAIVPQTFELTTSAWPTRATYGIGDEVALPMAPIAALSSVVYLDSTGAPITMLVTDYTVDNWSEPGWLYPAVNTTWPTLYGGPNAIKIIYSAGYTLPADSPNDRPCPKSIIAAMLLILGHLYENREETQAGGAGTTLLHQIPLGASSLLDRWRIRLGIA